MTAFSSHLWLFFLFASPAALSQRTAGPLGPVKLNDPMPIDVRGSVSRFLISPDEAWMVYRADADEDDVFELYSVPTDGSREARRLNLPLPSSGNVDFIFEITADSTHVVFKAPDVGSGYDAWSAPIDGSEPPTKLNDTGAVGGIYLHPDGQRALLSMTPQIYVVPLDGSSPPVPLNDSAIFASQVIGVTSDDRIVYYGNCCGYSSIYSSRLDQVETSTLLTPNTGVGVTMWAGAEVAANGTQVIYRANYNGQGERVYHVPVDASSPPAELNGPMAGNRVVQAFAVSADSSTVVYLSDEDQNNKLQLSAVPADGSAPPIRISGDLQPDGDVKLLSSNRGHFAITPDSAKVVYVADADVDGVNELYVVPIDVDEPSALKLNDPLSAGANVATFELDPESGWVGYTADALVDQRFDLYARPLDGSQAPARLNTQSFGANNGIEELILAGTKVFYTVLGGTSSSALFASERDGLAAPVRISQPFVANGHVSSFIANVAGDFVYYGADHAQDQAVEVFGRPADASADPVLMNGELLAVVVGDVYQVLLDPTETTVLFTANQLRGDTRELFARAIDGSGPLIRLNDEITAPGGLVHDVQLTPDGTHAVYLANQVFTDRCELFLVPIDGSAPAVRLSGPMQQQGNVVEYSMHADTVVYRADQLVDGRFDLFSRPLDRSTPAIRLNTDVLPDGDVDEYLVDEAATHVLMLGDLLVNGRDELFSAPLDGSAAALRLNDPLDPSADVEAIALSPDGTTALFIADQVTLGIDELFAVPVSGGVSPSRLSGPLGTGSDVWDFEVHASGRVVYRADVVHPALELFSVKLDGTDLVALNGPLPATSHVWGWQFTGSGSLAYQADERVAGIRELYSVPLDGSTASLPLVTNLPSHADVLEFTYDSISDRVVYTADLSTDGQSDLFSVSADGSSAPVQLNDPLPAGGNVSLPTVFSPDGTVVFLGDLRRDNRFELFRANLDGSGPLRRVHPPLAPWADVGWFLPYSAGVLYRANQDDPAAGELYATRRVPGIAPR